MVRDIGNIEDPDRRLAVQCLLAGIRAAKPKTVIDEQISLYGTDLIIEGNRYAIDDYRNVVVLRGGNAPATAARALETLFGARIDRGAVVTNNPVETERIKILPGDHPIPVNAASRVPDELWNWLRQLNPKASSSRFLRVVGARLCQRQLTASTWTSSAR